MKHPLTSPAALKIGVWADSENDFSLLEPVLEQLPGRYEVRRFSHQSGTTEDGVRVLLSTVDMVWFESCSEIVPHGSRLAAGVPAICRLHQAEAYTDAPKHVAWNNVDFLAVPTQGVLETLRQVHGTGIEARTQVRVLPDAVFPARYSFDERREPGFDIACLNRMDLLRSPMLVLQVLRRLVDQDERYVLHVAGPVTQYAAAQYFEHQVHRMGLQQNVCYYADLDEAQVPHWLAQCSYFLDASIALGHPAHVLRAMATGLKPVVHDGVGAGDVLPGDYLFRTVDEAVAMIRSARYEPKKYRRFVEERYNAVEQVSRYVQLLDEAAAHYYPERLAPQLQERGQAGVPAAGDPVQNLAQAQAWIRTGQIDEAAELFARLPFDTLGRDDALVARGLALHVQLIRGQYADALFHADAALDMTDREPLVHHLVGQALWQTGHDRAAAESLVRAAEAVLEHTSASEPFVLPFDAAAVFFMAGEACQHFEEHEAALSFYRRALSVEPQNAEIAEAVRQAAERFELNVPSHMV